MFDDGFDKLDDELKAEEQLRSENKYVRSRETKVNEFGDRVGPTEIYQGILLIMSVVGIATCACIKGCQEIRKHINKNNDKAKVIQLQHSNQR